MNAASITSPPISIDYSMLRLAAALWRQDRLDLLIGFKMKRGRKPQDLQKLFLRLQNVMPEPLLQELVQFHDILLNYHGEPIHIQYPHEVSDRLNTINAWINIFKIYDPFEPI